MIALAAGILIVATSRTPGFTLFGVVLIILGLLWSFLSRWERA